jgi:hypothetical protein
MSEHIVKKNSKHIVCTNVLKYGKCIRGDTCIFAHTLDELVDVECKFSKNNKCKNGRFCRFKHFKETRELYHRRVGISFDKKEYTTASNPPEVKTTVDDSRVNVNIYDSLLSSDDDE